MTDLTALANLMPHTEWCVAEHYGPGLACDDPSCQNVRQDEAADLVANRDLLLVALEHAGVLRRQVRRVCSCGAQKPLPRDGKDGLPFIVSHRFSEWHTEWVQARLATPWREFTVEDSSPVVNTAGE